MDKVQTHRAREGKIRMITPNKLREAAKNQDTQQMTQSLIEAANVIQLAVMTIDCAKGVIRAWHDMRTPAQQNRNVDDDQKLKLAEVQMWQLYQESPEMKMLNTFLRYRDPVLPEDAQFAASLLQDLKGVPDRSEVLAITDNLDRHILGNVRQLRSLALTVAISAK
jgi:hypothetical protein